MVINCPVEWYSRHTAQLSSCLCSGTWGPRSRSPLQRASLAPQTHTDPSSTTQEQQVIWIWLNHMGMPDETVVPIVCCCWTRLRASWPLSIYRLWFESGCSLGSRQITWHSFFWLPRTFCRLDQCSRVKTSHCKEHQQRNNDTRVPPQHFTVNVVALTTHACRLDYVVPTKKNPDETLMTHQSSMSSLCVGNVCYTGWRKCCCVCVRDILCSEIETTAPRCGSSEVEHPRNVPSCLQLQAAWLFDLLQCVYERVSKTCCKWSVKLSTSFRLTNWLSKVTGDLSLSCNLFKPCIKELPITVKLLDNFYWRSDYACK